MTPERVQMYTTLLAQEKANSVAFMSVSVSAFVAFVLVLGGLVTIAFRRREEAWHLCWTFFTTTCCTFLFCCWWQFYIISQWRAEARQLNEMLNYPLRSDLYVGATAAVVIEILWTLSALIVGLWYSGTARWIWRSVRGPLPLPTLAHNPVPA